VIVSRSSPDRNRKNPEFENRRDKESKKIVAKKSCKKIVSLDRPRSSDFSAAENDRFPERT